MQNTVMHRGINFVVHFTRAKNLESILKHGILPISELQTYRIDYERNDDYRLDGCHDASSFSIGFPNYRMFYKYRLDNPNVDWVVLGVKKEVLWEKNCAFCVENAAKTSISNSSIAERSGVFAFKSLYEEFPEKPSRQTLKLHQSLPTNPQAEVLVFGKVEPHFIFAVAFESEEVKDKYKYLLTENVSFEVQKWLYNGRHDYVHWR